jgi:hypothetical protein
VADKIAPRRESQMDQVRECIAVLRRLAKEPDDPDCVVLAEQAINDYLRKEIEALRAALERIGKAIDEEAAKDQGEDWSLMVGYIQACLEKLPGELEEWQKD